MPFPPRRTGRLHRFAGLVLPALVAVTAVWAPAALVAAGPVPEPSPGAQSIHYVEALAHRDDPNRFFPGARVNVGLRPRLADTRRLAAMPAIAAADPSASADPLASPGLPVPAPLPGTLQRQVIGFLPYWEVADPTLTLRYDLLSTIAYFSVGVDANGNLVRTNSDGSTSTGWAGWTSSKMTSIITAAHAAGTRVALTLTLFAWSSSDRAKQIAVLGSDSARQNLATQAAAAVRDRGADGVNVDMEPIAAGYDDEFADFVRKLRTALDAIAPGYEITVDTTAEVKNYPLEALIAPGAADAIFIMGYDYRGSGASNAGSIAPYAGSSYDLNDALSAFLARVPADRLILGLPYYGRAWSTVSNEPNARNQSGTKYGTSVTAIYDTAATLAAENGRRYDPVEHSAWTAYRRETCTSTYGCVMSWRELYYDDAQSLGMKYELVNQLNLRGTGMWALGYDERRPELWQALSDHLATPPSLPAEEPSLTLTASQTVILWGSQITLSADFGSLGANRSILFQWSRDGLTFSDIRPVTADAAGRASTTFAPSDNRYYRAVFQGAADLAPHQSTSVRVVVRQWAPLRPFSNGRLVRAGSTLTVSTTVRPSRLDLPVPVVRYVLYRLVAGRWSLVTTEDITADAAGIARWTVTFPGRADWYVRSMALPTPLNANSAWSQINRYSSR